jgi:hypothetical protein
MATRSPVTSKLHELGRTDAVLAAVCFAAAIAVYIRTLAPGLLLGDSGEFQTLAYTMGTTHATGYPVYILLAKLFTVLEQIGSIAYRVNLFSAITAALTASLVYLLGRVLAGWRLPALAAAAALAVDKLFWWHAVIAERMTFAAALVAAVLLLLLHWRQTGKWQNLFLAGLLGGLSLGVHNTVGLVAPAVLIYLLISTRRRQDWIGAASGAAAGLVLALTAFLVVEAIDPPSGYYYAVLRPSLSLWGLTSSDIASPIQRVEFLLSAAQFRQFMFTQPLGALRVNASSYWNFFRDGMPGKPVLLGILAGLGIVTLIFRRWREGLLLVLAWLGMMAFILNYAISDLFSFYVPTYVPLLPAVAAGIGLPLDGLARALRSLRQESWKAPAIDALGLILLLFLSIPSAYIAEAVRAGRIEFLNTMYGNFPFNEYPYPVNEPERVYQQAKTLVDKLEDNAIVFTDWETLYPLYYVAHVEEGRTGMAFHETFPQDGVTRLADSAVTYIEANMERRPIYAVNRSFSIFMIHYRLVPIGHQLFRLEPKN